MRACRSRTTAIYPAKSISCASGDTRLSPHCDSTSRHSIRRRGLEAANVLIAKPLAELASSLHIVRRVTLLYSRVRLVGRVLPAPFFLAIYHFAYPSDYFLVASGACGRWSGIG